MFCKQCGTQNSEGVNTCTNCGAAIENGTPTPKNSNFDPVALFYQLRGSKYFIPGLAGLALVIVLLIIFCSGGATKPIDKYISAMSKANVNKYIAAFPKEYTEDWDEDDIEDMLSDDLDDLEDEYGKNVKIKCKVLDKEKYDEDDLEDLAESLEDWYDLDEDDVTAAYRVICKLTIKGSDEKDVNYQMFVVIKYDGKWYLHPQYS